MLITRALVGTIGAVIAIAVLYAGGPALLIALILLTFLGLHEFYRMTRAWHPVRIAGFLGGLLVLIGAYSDLQLAGAMRGVIYLFGLVFLFHAVRGLREEMVGEMAVTFLGAFYVSVGFAHIILLRDFPVFGTSLAFLVLIATWTSDTVAYAVGHYLGQRPISPVVSPKKTLEGTAAGFIATVLVVVIAGKSLGWGLGSGQFFLLGVGLGIAAPVGDLFESYIKRASHVKDAGTIIPGHGGILDRFDSLLFTGVTAYYLVQAMIG